MEVIKSLYNKIDIAKNYIYYIFLIALMLSIALLVFTFNISIDQTENVYSPQIARPTLIKNVTLTSSSGTVENVELPVKRDPSQSYSYSFVVEKDINDMQQCINVNVSYTSFFIRHKGEVIFARTVSADSVVASMGASFDIIEVPNKYLGEELEIEFISNLGKNRDYIIPEILIGAKGAIRKYHFYNDLVKLIASVSLFITALFIAVIGFFFIKIGQMARNVFIAVLFTIIMSFYIFFRAWIVFYFFENAILAYFIEYTCLMIMPLPLFLLFLNIFYENNYYNWRAMTFEYFVVAILLNLIIQWILTLSGISEFVLMQNISIWLLAVSGLYIYFVILTIDGKRVENKKYLVISISPLMFLAIFGVIGYFRTFVVPMVPLIIISVVFFLMTHVVLALKKHVMEYNTMLENEFYSQLAYFDRLTQLANRHDFERDVAAIISKKIKFGNVYLIMLDMNNLKQINDNYGHKMGDEYLIAAGDGLLRIEKKYQKIKAYRYGGDEFIILAYDKRERELEKIISDIDSFSNYAIKDCEYVLEFAVGFSLCSNQNSFELRALKNDADKHMYADKVRKKGASANAR